MNPVGYQLQSFREEFKILQETRGGYNQFLVFCDYLGAALRYGASAADYFTYEFYDKRRRARQPFVCWRLKKKFMKIMNDYSKAHIFNNKVEFLDCFSKFIGREWLDVASVSFEEFVAFCWRHETFIAKPQNLSCGRGVRKVVAGENQEKLYQQLKEEKALIEEIIVQHRTMQMLYPHAVNSIRLAAAYVDGQMIVLGAVLRCGSGGNCIDNHGAGGWALKIEPVSGIVVSDGCNIRRIRQCKHPDSGIIFHGFQIPHWDKVLQLVEEAGTIVPGVRYVGWDVAIREDDVVLIEGNFEGMFNVLQQPADQGIKEEVLRILDTQRQKGDQGKC